MKSKNLQNLIFSPFHTSRILHAFLTGVQVIRPSGTNYELFKIVLPLIYNELLCDQLSKLIATSKFHSFFNRAEIRLQLVGFKSKVDDYDIISKQALIMLGSLTDIKITDRILVQEALDFSIETEPTLKTIYKAAFNLGRLIANENNLTIFLNLGLNTI